MTPAIPIANSAYRQPFWALPDRRITMACSAAVGVLFIAILTATFPADGRAAQSAFASGPNQEVMPPKPYNRFLNESTFSQDQFSQDQFSQDQFSETHLVKRHI